MTNAKEEVQRILAVDQTALTDVDRMKLTMAFLGYIEGLHTNTDKLRNQGVVDDSTDPMNHNIEQAQISLEVASMRLQQVARHLENQIIAATNPPDSGPDQD